MPTRATTQEIPQPDAFRAWLEAALIEVEQSPFAAARAINAGVNTVARFLREPMRDITLSRAATLERHLRLAAKDQGKELPAIMARSLEFAGGDHV